MYQPAAFVQEDPAQLAGLMRTHPLATLVRHTPEGGLTADLIPLLWEPDATGMRGRLVGHVARANPLWREASGQSILAIFQGPQAYVTPSWYPSKAANGQVVPTWNYAVVQAYGTLSAIDDRDWLLGLVTRLTAEHEGRRAAPWKVSDAPADYIEKMLRAIVGIEIAVTRLEGKWKASQNRSRPDRLGVQAGLLADGSDEARAMALLVRPSDEASSADSTA